MKKQKIALCIITKNEEQNLANLFNSVKGFVDKIYLTDTGSTDNTVSEAKRLAKLNRLKLDISHFEWVDDFAKARNYNFSQVSSDFDWVLWLDGDDTLEGNLANLANFLRYTDSSAVVMDYHYLRDEKGQLRVAHTKVRMVRNGVYEWSEKAPIHENLFIKEEYKDKQKEVLVDSAWVVHHKEESGFEASGKRNLRILQKLRQKELSEGREDLRTLFLLGRENYNMFITYGDDSYKKVASKSLRDYIVKQQKGYEVVEACAMLCDIAVKNYDLIEYEKLADLALRAAPTYPLPYILKASYYLYIGEYKLVEDWCELALRQKQTGEDGSMRMEKGNQRRILDLLGEAYYEQKKLDKLAKIIAKQKKLLTRSELKNITDKERLVKAEKNAKRIIDSFTVMAHTLLREDELESITPLLKILPGSLQNHKSVVSFRRSIGLGDSWLANTITIYCGGGYEEWDESSLDSGLGGSETAVVELAKRFGEAGYKVSVYNSISKPKSYGNVTYIPANNFDPADTFNVLFVWRNPTFVKRYGIKSKKTYLWLHDVPNVTDYTVDVVNSYDKIIMLTKFHRSFLKHVPEDKIYYSSNGIDVESIEKIEQEKIKRIPKKMIYASSPDRGLDKAMDIFEKLQEEDSGWELHWAYGWNTFDAIRKDKKSLGWKEEMVDRMNKLGVVQHGRIGKDDLYRLYFSSNIWLYPTQFDEINCIVAQEAQACGCIPVTTLHGALQEVVIENTFYLHEGVVVKDLFNQVLNTEDQTLHLEARERFDWQNTADAWLEDLIPGSNQEDPLVSVIMTTIRPGAFRVLKDTLEKQTYKNFEVIVIDGRYEERKGEVAEYMNDVDYPFLHIPDPERDKARYPYGLCHAFNTSLEAANGELHVHIQDFILIPNDGIEKFVKLYKLNPEALYTGVDERWTTISQGDEDLPRSVDIYLGGQYELEHKDFTSGRIRIGDAVRTSYNPFEWELNYAALPAKHVKEKLGAWQEDWDKAFGYDNTELALRHIYLGGKILVDETNLCKAISHWDLFDEHDSEGVPERTKKTNDERYYNYATYLEQTNDAKVKMKLNVKYKKDIKNKLLEWKNGKR